MLEAAGIAFESRSADFDEEVVKEHLRATGLPARDLAATLAERKALAVAADAGELVLGADQTLERSDGSMIDKPTSREEAREQLLSLRGRTHRLHAGAAIVDQGKIVWSNVETVELSVRPFTDAFLSTYLDREYEAIRHGVGGYRIEALGVQLFDRIEGSHFAILGLPLLDLLAQLRERGVLES
jgi:septum formation protein